MAKQLLKASIIVSAMTFLSRILGLIRDIVVANFMGAGAAADVFFFANKIPNFLRRLFAEGAFAQAFIPVLAEVQAENDDKKLREFVAKISGTLGAIVFVTAVVGVIASPVLAAMFGMGWFVDYVNDEPGGQKFELASLLLKITFPYIFFISLAGFVGAVLNTLNKFAATAFTPVLLNVCIIGCAYYLSPYVSDTAFALAWGVFLGGFVQLTFQLPFLFRAGLLVKPKWGWSDPNVKKVRVLMIPALFGVSVSQINLLLDTLIASFLMTGSISWLYYSDRLLEFPLGLFGIAIATVILPTLSRNHVSSDKKAFSRNIDWALRLIAILGIPASVALIVLAMPLLLVIFQRGEFSTHDTLMASYSLMAYASGLFSFMLVKIFAPAFYSRQDTKTPVRYGIITMAANMVFNLILAIPFSYVGLAMATALSGSLNAFLLYRRLSILGVFKISTSTWWFLARVLVASLIMTSAIYTYSMQVDWFDLVLRARILELIATIAIGVGVYGCLLLLLGVRPNQLVSNQDTGK
ncbi:murein biosynthesis integral membrane protein MurJ [Glaciecola petra]|uniref:Probable lipid II flippase MurJ n=1 Tax=Glaciecola petra TaxID=3075602 RepID=A0ABU2ZTV2_9ALTE|nr:murein biosynthesis integral membrane protein MurJ [Aestuariibacter sp. P117]MDT0595836.1 murein biosynthesis integral membrane protein MurJ [Aestuariibacter sp. P117]